MERPLVELLAPPFSDRHIIRTAGELTLRHLRSVGRKRAFEGINFDDVYENLIYPEYEIVLIEDEDLGHTADGEKILGRYDVAANTAFVDVCFRHDPSDSRRAFTRWHEVAGHGVLQGPWLRRQLSRIGDDASLVTTESVLSIETTVRIERQANLFAAHAAAPLLYTNYQIVKTFDLHQPYQYIGPGRYSFVLDSGTRTLYVNSFEHLTRLIAFYIRPRFGGLSVEALSYQVAQCVAVQGSTAFLASTEPELATL